MQLTMPTGDIPKSPLDILLKAIEDGELRPGQRLLETEIAAQLGISRTPVREALHRLQALGLAQPGPQRGLIVAHITYPQLRQLFVVREGLEGMTARMAAENASHQERDLLRDMVNLEAGFTDPRILSSHNKQLHRQIALATHNSYMVDTLAGLRTHLSLLPTPTYLVPGRTKSAHEEHQAIVDAIARGDPDAAEQASRQHVRSAYSAHLSVFSAEDHN